MFMLNTIVPKHDCAHLKNTVDHFTYELPSFISVTP